MKSRRRALLRRLECAVEPARLAGFQWILSQRLVNVFAVATSECPQIGAGTSGLDAEKALAATIFCFTVVSCNRPYSPFGSDGEQATP